MKSKPSTLFSIGIAYHRVPPGIYRLIDLIMKKLERETEANLSLGNCNPDLRKGLGQ